ncbi:MAG TPA: trypsin-like serine protease, partial [Candidatus Acidoferrum sp.]|nr:trypsin-like serine protease [Candidatus Acidoferrum sp.]
MDSKREAPESTARRPSFLRSPLLGAALVASLAGCASEPPDDPDVGSTAEDIIGGFPITSPKLNAIGALGFDVGGGIFVPFCSGTLISPTMVVTAKHCVNFITDPSPFAFLVGPSALAPIRVVPARGAAVEPTFPEIGVVGLGSDVGILHLAQPVTDVTPLPFAALTDDQIGNRLVGVGYGVQNSDGASGTRMGGSMTLKATGGSVYAAAFDSFEGFVQEGAPKLFPELDPTNPDDLAVLQQIFDETVLIDGIEGWFGSGPQDAQICFGDSGGPITRKVGTTTTLFGVASWVFSLDGSTCELDGGAYASMNPVSLDFIDYETHCPLVPRAGTCDGLTVAIRCTNPNEGGRRIVTTDCDQLGLLCALDESGAVGCTDDPCEG